MNRLEDNGEVAIRASEINAKGSVTDGDKPVRIWFIEYLLSWL